MKKKIIMVVIAAIFIIGISVGATLLVDKVIEPTVTIDANGLAEYELARQYGYEGTEQEWLEALDEKSSYQIAVDSGYKGTESEWRASLKEISDNTASVKNEQINSKGELDDKTPYILNGTWWIDNVNTGIKAEDENGIEAKRAYVDEEEHLIIVMPDNTEIDAGCISAIGNVVPLEEFTVIFKDYDGTVLKTEEVESGKAAMAPEEPCREGYKFTGWNQPFSNVISEMEIVAQYQKITFPTLAVENVTATDGVTNVEVVVQAYNNPGIVGMTLGVEYDENVLTLTNVISQEVLSGLSFQKPKTYNSGCNLVWYGTEPDEVVDGIAFKLIFTITESAESGTYPITLTYSTGYDTSLESIDMEVVNGSIVIN